MKKVLVWGTFDILHLGHIQFLKQAKRRGDYLVVLLSRNKIAAKIKGRPPIHNEKERLAMIRSIKFVDEAHLDREKADYLMIKKIRPDVICLGYDQVAYTEKLPKVLRQFKLNTRVVRLKAHRPEKYKSTKIKNLLVGGIYARH